MQKPKFYVTTPIYYVNDAPHVGHAYTTMAADIVARFYRLLGYNVFFLTGTDEHGQKLENAAKDAGMAPKDFADKVVLHFKEMNKELNISNDHFIRTTDSYHVEFCKLMYDLLKSNGDIYKGDYSGLYCVACEKFVKEVDLEDGKCPDHKIVPQPVKEESYFFKLSKYQDKLLAFYEKNPDFISPAFRQQEIINRVKEGLNDLSISRTSITWGIPVPDDPAHVMYVWIDALSNYISALGYPGEKYQKYWPANVHIIGKDIAWFHMVIWPAMLMSAGLPLPQKVFAHGFWTVDGTKMSKTLGNAVRPIEMKKKYGIEAFKYYLFSKAQFGQDNDFSERELVDVLNSELADDFGNLVNRIVVLIQKYFGGLIPVPAEVTPEETAFSNQFTFTSEIMQFYKDFEFSRVLKSLWDILRSMNKYITDKEPWVLFKQKKIDELAIVLFNLLEGTRIVITLLQPLLPETSQKVLDVFGVTARGLDATRWRFNAGYSNGSLLKAPSLILFTKKEFIVEEKPKGENQKMSQPSDIPPIKPEISYDDFSKVDMRSAKIVAAEGFPDSKKLVKLTVECGTETRTIVAGIAQYYTIDQLVGKRIIIVANLAPRKLHGVKSEGMLLAVDINDEPILLQSDKDTKTGYPIR